MLSTENPDIVKANVNGSGLDIVQSAKGRSVAVEFHRGIGIGRDSVDLRLPRSPVGLNRKVMSKLRDARSFHEDVMNTYQRSAICVRVVYPHKFDAHAEPFECFLLRPAFEDPDALQILDVLRLVSWRRGHDENRVRLTDHVDAGLAAL
jgi:hypothetical protein